MLINVATSDPAEVGRIAGEARVDAIVADSFAGDVLQLMRTVGSMPVLRPIYEKQTAYRDGPIPELFSGYGRLAEEGELLVLEDLSLRRSP